MRYRGPEWLWRVSIRLHRARLRPLAKGVKVLNYLMHRALLPSECEVGRNLTLEHYALGVVIHPKVALGDDVRVYHHVTIAGELPLDSEKRVLIGDRATIGVNAVILPRPYEGLTIGEDAIIGAGAVVTCDVPPGAIVTGVPGKVVRYRGSSQTREGDAT